MVEAVWSATSPESGRFDASVTRSTVELLEQRFEMLRARGEGYVEIGRGDAYPVLAFGFRGSTAVVQAFTSKDAISLLAGDEPPRSDLIEVLIMDEDAAFSGQAAIDTERGWRVVLEFLAGGELAELGHWIAL